MARFNPPQCRQHVLVGQLLRERRDERDGLGISLLVERRGGRRAPAGATPMALDTAENRDEPSATVRAGLEWMERLKRLYQRLLNEIFGLIPVAFKPHGEAKEPLHVREHLSLEH